MSCPPQLRSRQYLSGPQVFWLLLDKVGSIGGNIWDIKVDIPYPVNAFFIASIRNGDESNSMWISLTPTNYPRGFPFTTMKGTEQLFPLNSAQPLFISSSYYGVVQFKKPVQTVYFHMGTENGAASRYTIGCFADDTIEIHGGIYT